MDTRWREQANSLGLLILRIGIGGYMLLHGWGKLQTLIAGKFDEFGDPIGLGSSLSLVLVVIAEFVGALMVMLGLATRVAALFPVGAMAVAAFVAHASDPWSMETAARLFMAGEAKSWGSKEPAMLFLIPFLAIVFTGPGRFSLDAVLAARWRGKREPQQVS